MSIHPACFEAFRCSQQGPGSVAEASGSGLGLAEWSPQSHEDRLHSVLQQRHSDRGLDSLNRISEAEAQYSSYRRDQSTALDDGSSHCLRSALS